MPCRDIRPLRLKEMKDAAVRTEDARRRNGDGGTCPIHVWLVLARLVWAGRGDDGPGSRWGPFFAPLFSALARTVMPLLS